MEYFDIYNFNQLCEPIIYLLIKHNTYKRPEVVYVGQSKRGIKRIFEHKNKDFSDIAIIPCEEKDLNKLEQFYIEMYRPKYNKSNLKKIENKQNKKVLEILNSIS